MSTSMLLDEPKSEAAVAEAAIESNTATIINALNESAVENIDELDNEDPQCVVEYVTDIYQFLRVKVSRTVVAFITLSNMNCRKCDIN
jgi:hypothetical protein